MYHIPENQIPADLKADKPRPETWGEFAVAYLPMQHHTCQNIAEPQAMLFMSSYIRRLCLYICSIYRYIDYVYI